MCIRDRIRQQLEALGITQGTIYPEIERVAEYIKGVYSCLLYTSPTGELEVHFVVKHDSVVRAALAAYYAEHKEQLGDAGPLAERTRPTALAQALVR